MLVALEHELISPESPDASILETVVVKRAAQEEVEDHRRMVDLLTAPGHRHRAIASIIDRMTYLELIDFADEMFKDVKSLEAANFPSALARWARTAREP
jgi:hypothetical protein